MIFREEGLQKMLNFQELDDENVSDENDEESNDDDDESSFDQKSFLEEFGELISDRRIKKAKRMVTPQIIERLHCGCCITETFVYNLCQPSGPDDPELLKYFIELGIPIGNHDLFSAVCGQKTEILRFLLDQGLDVNAYHFDYPLSPLRQAFTFVNGNETSDHSFYRTLIDAGAKMPDTTPGVPYDARKFFEKRTKTRALTIVVLGFAKCKSSVLGQYNGRNVLEMIGRCVWETRGHVLNFVYFKLCLLSDRIDDLKKMLTTQNITDVGESGSTIDYLCKFGPNNRELTKHFLRLGAPTRDHDLFTAVYHEKHEVLRALLDHGLNVDTTPMRKITPLGVVFLNFNQVDAACCKVLIDAGAQISNTEKEVRFRGGHVPRPATSFVKTRIATRATSMAMLQLARRRSQVFGGYNGREVLEMIARCVWETRGHTQEKPKTRTTKRTKKNK